LTGIGDQTEAIVKRVLHGTNHIEVRYGSRHSLPKIGRPGRKGGGNDAPPRRRVLSLSSLRSAAALLSPQQGRHLSPPFLTQTLQTDRGDTMYLSNSSNLSNLPPPVGVDKRSGSGLRGWWYTLKC